MGDSRRELTVFYAWQSDTPQHHNRSLIESALNEVRDRLNADADVRYPVMVTSDTKGVPGLCDIPAEILKKIAAADAIVLDLTFVASTAAETPKKCPNPNVLFELGYAFHAVGPERLICVMNETHGNAAETMFDIAHRRRPIAYSSPVEGKTRSQVISKLAEALFDAIKPSLLITKPADELDSEAEFKKETEAIKAHWSASVSIPQPFPVMFFSLRPLLFEKRHFRNADALDDIIRKHQVVDLSQRHHYPPSVTGTATMPWGIYNGTYSRPSWALTYSGQFWAALPLYAHCEYTSSSRDGSIYRHERDLDKPIPPVEWIDYPYARIDAADPFKFAASLAAIFPPNDELTWNAHAEGLAGTTLAASITRFSLCSRKCASPTATAGYPMRAADFAANWKECCLDFLEELFGMFDILGQRIGRDTLRKFLDDRLVGREV